LCKQNKTEISYRSEHEKDNRHEKEDKNNKNNDLMNHGTFFNNPHSVAFEPANLT
jgi:hypothetical protein